MRDLQIGIENITEYWDTPLNFKNFYWSIVALQCRVSFYCTAKWISYAYPHIPSLGFLYHLGHHRALSRVPCTIRRFSLVIYFTYSSVYMSILISQFISPLPVPTFWATSPCWRVESQEKPQGTSPGVQWVGLHASTAGWGLCSSLWAN